MQPQGRTTAVTVGAEEDHSLAPPPHPPPTPQHHKTHHGYQDRRDSHQPSEPYETRQDSHQASEPSRSRRDSYQPRRRSHQPRRHLHHDWTTDLPNTEHVRFFRETDWGATPLGPLEHWDPTLRLYTRMLLADSRPACLWW
jgi:hypothetical protein